MDCKTLEDQLNSLQQVIDFSPYLSSESRRDLEREAAKLSELINLGEITDIQGKKLIIELNQMAAFNEVNFLLAKIGHLNPTSPRLSMLQNLVIQLERQELSPDQIRKEIQRIMRY